jgi:O-antigen ligase
MASRRLLLIDVGGLLLVGAFGTWIVFCGAVTGRSPWPMLLTLLLCAGAFVVGRWVSQHVGVLVIPIGVVMQAIVALGISGGERWALQTGFLGYGNANAAFFVQAAFATLMIAAAIRSSRNSFLISLAALLFAAVTIRIRSLGGLLTSALLIPAAIAIHARRVERTLTRIVLVGLAIAIAASFPLAYGFARAPYSPPLWNAAKVVGHGRAALWGEAYEILRENPATGIGPGGFRVASPSARAHAPYRWTHNEYVQQAAETGLIGLGLLLSLLGWTFFRLERRQTARSTLGTLALAAFAAHAIVDYLFHFPLLAAMAGALAGSSLDSSSSTDHV